MIIVTDLLKSGKFSGKYRGILELWAMETHICIWVHYILTICICKTVSHLLGPVFSCVKREYE